MGSKVWCFYPTQIPSFDAHPTLCKFLACFSQNPDPKTEMVTKSAIFGVRSCKVAHFEAEIVAVSSNTSLNHFQFFLGVIFGGEVSQQVPLCGCCFSLKAWGEVKALGFRLVHECESCSKSHLLTVGNVASRSKGGRKTG